MANVFNLGGGSSGGIQLQSIAITKDPKKTYKVGETFSKEGMEVTATYTNGATRVVTGYEFSPSTPLTEGTIQITITYAEAGGMASTEVEVTVTRTEIPIPSQLGTLTYNKSQQSPRWQNYNEEQVDIVGSTLETDAGDYEVTFNCKDAYTFPGNSHSEVVAWKIGKVNVTLPTQTVALTYNGSPQGPTWSDTELDKFTIGGQVREQNAGNYNAEFTPQKNYQWQNNGGSEMRLAPWSIAKAQGSLTATSQSVTLDKDHTSQVVTLLVTGDGELSVDNPISSIVSTQIGSKNITISSVGNKSGSGTITVKLAEGINYTGNKQASISVEAKFGFEWGDQTAVGEADWWAELRQYVLDRNNCSDFIGKKKLVSLSPAVQGANKASMTCIGWNIDGTNTLTFQTTGTLPTNTSFGSSAEWNGSTIQTICNNFADRCSASASLKQITIQWCSETGSKNNAPDKEFTCKGFLPSECQMGLAGQYGTSSSEWTKGGAQRAYPFYNSNSARIKYQMTSEGVVGSSAQWYWERSRGYYYSNYVCRVFSGGSAGANGYDGSNGAAPAFVIG